MRCYCSEISRCKLDIKNIEQMISTFSDAESYNEQTDSMLLRVANCTHSAITPKNIDSLCNGIEKGNKYVKSNIDSAKIECSEQLSRLNRLLSIMKREDTAYHTMENK